MSLQSDAPLFLH